MSDQSIIPIEYREVDGFPGYRVGNDGSVQTQKGHARSKILREWRNLKLCKDTSGYLTVYLSHAGKKATMLVHHLVLRSFGIERPTPKHETRHLNGNCTDNTLGNLKWGTPKENNADQVSHGTRVRGEKCSSARLTEDDIRRIRFDLSHLNNTEVARLFSVDRSHICKIRKNKKWKHVT